MYKNFFPILFLLLAIPGISIGGGKENVESTQYQAGTSNSLKFVLQMSTGDAWSFDRLSITSPKAGSFEISDLQSDSFFEYNLLEKSLVKSKYLLLLKGGSKDTGLFLVLRGYDFPGSGRELRVIHLNQENLERSKQVFQSNRVDYVVDVKTCEQTEHICLVLKPRDDRYDRTVYVLQNDTFALDKKLSKELMKSYGHRPTSYSQ